MTLALRALGVVAGSLVIGFCAAVSAFRYLPPAVYAWTVWLHIVALIIGWAVIAALLGLLVLAALPSDPGQGMRGVWRLTLFRFGVVVMRASAMPPNGLEKLRRRSYVVADLGRVWVGVSLPAWVWRLRLWLAQEGGK